MTTVSRVSTNYLGAITLGIGVVSGAIALETIRMWRQVADYRNSLPAAATEGGTGFSLQLLPLLFTAASIALGIVTAILLAAAVANRRSRRQPQSLFLNLATALSLLPALYIVIRMGTRFSR